MKRTITSLFLDFLLPDNCPICRKQPGCDLGICDDCRRDVPFIFGTVCPKCGGPLMTDHSLCRECEDSPRLWWNVAASAFRFEGTARSVVHRFKYHGDVAVVPFIADSCLNAWKDRCGDTAIDCLAPVPLHWFRKFTRGYNQSDMICRELGRRMGVEICDALKRTRWTPPQAQLSRSKRTRNLSNAFAVRDNAAVAGKSIMLVDDVMTTGTTLNECARKLVKAGAKEVNVLTIARRL